MILIEIVELVDKVVLHDALQLVVEHLMLNSLIEIENFVLVE
jgi:hypothetical protein